MVVHLPQNGTIGFDPQPNAWNVELRKSTAYKSVSHPAVSLSRSPATPPACSGTARIAPRGVLPPGINKTTRVRSLREPGVLLLSPTPSEVSDRFTPGSQLHPFRCGHSQPPKPEPEPQSPACVRASRSRSAPLSTSHMDQVVAKLEWSNIHSKPQTLLSPKHDGSVSKRRDFGVCFCFVRSQLPQGSIKRPRLKRQVKGQVVVMSLRFASRLLSLHKVDSTQDWLRTPSLLG